MFFSIENGATGKPGNPEHESTDEDDHWGTAQVEDDSVDSSDGEEEEDADDEDTESAAGSEDEDAEEAPPPKKAAVAGVINRLNNFSKFAPPTAPPPKKKKTAAAKTDKYTFSAPDGGSSNLVDLSEQATFPNVVRDLFKFYDRFYLQARKVDVEVKGRKDTAAAEYSYEAMSIIRDVHENAPSHDANGKEIAPFVFNVPAKANKGLFACLYKMYGPSIAASVAGELFFSMYKELGLETLVNSYYKDNNNDREKLLKLAQPMFQDMHVCFGDKIAAKSNFRIVK